MTTEAQMNKELEDAIDKWLDDFVDKIFEISQRRLEAENKIDTGLMMKTGNVVRERLHKQIVYPTPYAGVVHDGRMPGTMPPTSALEGWAKRKLGVSDKEAKGVAFAIATKIKQRGTESFPFLEESVIEASISLE